MPRPPVLALHRAVGRRAHASLAVRCGLSLLTLIGGAGCLWLHWRTPAAGRYDASAGVVCLVAFVAQLRIGVAAWHGGRLFVARGAGEESRFWRRLFGGAFFAYAAALLAGSSGDGGCVWLAGTAVCYTILLLPLAASGAVLEGWRKWSQERAPRRLAWLVYAAMIAAIAGEGGLRLHRFVQTPAWQFSRPALAADLAARADMGPRNVAPVLASSATLRVAVLCDESTRGTLEARACLTRVEAMLPGVEIVAVGWGPGVTGESSGQMAAALADCRADLAVIVLTVCEELAREPAETNYFDWRQLELARLWTGGREATRAARGGPAACDDFESLLGVLAPQLTACRTPIGDAMGVRWQRTLARLDALLIGCRESRLPAALVVVPSEFQLDRALCETLARRTGSSAERLDVELPQRRIASYADQRHVPLLDLLPHLRLSSAPLYECNATSWNDEGHSAAAVAIGSWLEGRLAGQPALAARLSRAP